MRNKNSFILVFLVLILVVSFLAVPAGTKAQTVAASGDNQARITELTNQLNSLLKQLIVLLTAQVQNLQQQVAVKLRQQPAVTTPPAATATTTAQTVATSTAAAATSTAAVSSPVISEVATPPPQRRRRPVLSYPIISITVATSSTSTISVTASATNDDGSSSNIAEVVFTDISTNFGADTASPYASGNRVLTAGVHTISAVATDVQGQAKRSASTTLPSVPW